MYVAAEDIEAGPRTKFQTEPTLPIYLKVMYIFHILILSSSFSMPAPTSARVQNFRLIFYSIIEHEFDVALCIWAGKDEAYFSNHCNQ